MSRELDKYTIGQRIMILREERGIMSQEKLAELVNDYSDKNGLGLKPLSRQGIKRIENGEAELKIGTVFALSKILGVDCDYIITGIKKADETVSSDLGLSQKLIDQLKQNQRPGWADIFNYLCENDCYKLSEALVIFLDNDFDYNPFGEAISTIQKLIAEGKITENDIDQNTKEFLVSETVLNTRDKRRINSLEVLKQIILDDHKRIHKEINGIVQYEVDKEDYRQEIAIIKADPARKKAAAGQRKRKGGSDHES